MKETFKKILPWLGIATAGVAVELGTHHIKSQKDIETAEEVARTRVRTEAEEKAKVEDILTEKRQEQERVDAAAQTYKENEKRKELEEQHDRFANDLLTKLKTSSAQAPNFDVPTAAEAAPLNIKDKVKQAVVADALKHPDQWLETDQSDDILEEVALSASPKDLMDAAKNNLKFREAIIAYATKQIPIIDGLRRTVLEEHRQIDIDATSDELEKISDLETKYETDKIAVTQDKRMMLVDRGNIEKLKQRLRHITDKKSKKYLDTKKLLEAYKAEGVKFGKKLIADKATVAVDKIKLKKDGGKTKKRKVSLQSHLDALGDEFEDPIVTKGDPAHYPRRESDSGLRWNDGDNLENRFASSDEEYRFRLNVADRLSPIITEFLKGH